MLTFIFYGNLVTAGQQACVLEEGAGRDSSVPENLPRRRWRLPLVEKVIEGRIGWCRVTQVKLANGIRIQNPFQLLYPLLA